MTKETKILLCGGGTGGHVFPVLAVAEELKKKNTQLLYIGSYHGPEAKIVPAHKINFKPILTGKWRRYFSLLNFIDLMKIILGFWQALSIILSFRPDVIFAKGGYVTLPIVLAGWLCRIPIVSHESDIVMGLANHIAARVAKKTCVSFAPQHYNLPPQKVVFTGNPVRQEFFKKTTAHSRPRQLPTITVMGGSLGSGFINQTISEILPELTQKYRIIHLIGQKEQPKSRERFKNYEIYGFIEDKLPALLSQADLVISRAGASSLFEIAAMGKPSILIPLPSAAGGHQTANARIFTQTGASLNLGQDRLSGADLKRTIEKLMSDPNNLKIMAAKARSLAQKEAAQNIAQEILAWAK